MPLLDSSILALSSPASAQRYAAQGRWESPLGGLTLAATRHGLAGAWFDGQKYHPGELDAPVNTAHPHIAAALQQLALYFEGRLRRFDLKLDPLGTPFQRRVWLAMAALEPGCTTTYGALAQALGLPQAARAVGAAVGRNPLMLIVPCHRVIGSDGSLTGYAGGLSRKQALLSLEGRFAPLATEVPQAA